MLLRFIEKGGINDAIPLRHDLEEWLLDYLSLFRLVIAHRQITASAPSCERQVQFPRHGPRNHPPKMKSACSHRMMCADRAGRAKIGALSPLNSCQRHHGFH